MNWSILLESAARAAIVIGIVGLGLRIAGVRSGSLKLAAWRAVVYLSLLMPVVALIDWKPLPAPAPVVRIVNRAASALPPARLVAAPVENAAVPFDWQSAAWRGYWLVAGLLLLRSLLGLARLRSLEAAALPVPQLGRDVFECDGIRVPVTYGFLRGKILLPPDWREWTSESLDAVLAHERSHIEQKDFLTQWLSKVNRAFYWANPLVWWLDRHVAALAEDVSDDAAIERVAERPSYAALLLGLAGRTSRATAAGVAMARRSNVSGRIERILDDRRMLSLPVSKPVHFSLIAAIFGVALLVGACHVGTASAQTPAPPVQPKSSSTRPSPPSPSANSKPGYSYWWSDRNQMEWALITPNWMSMSGGQGASQRAQSFKSREHGDYIWFSLDGKEYLLDDAESLKTVEEWFRPIQELGRRQGELGEKQGELGRQQGVLGEQMGRLGEQMSGVKTNMPDLTASIRQLEAEARRLNKQASGDELANLQSRLGELQALLGEAQGRMGDNQAKLGEQQALLGAEQAKLGEQQAILGEQQGRLGEEQGRLANEAEQKLKNLFQQAIQNGRAKIVR